jgi:EF hand
MRVGSRSVSIVLTIALSGCAGNDVAGTAPATANPIDEARLKRHFAIMDEDQDGFISRPEFQSERGAVFLAVDRNNSFTLTSDEMQLTPEAFQKLAGDNGVVDIGELFSSDAISFEKVDANGDKQLSFGEFSEFILHFGS